MSAIFQQRTAPRTADVAIVPETDVGTGRGLPYSLGLLGFCIAAFIFGAVYANWVPTTNQPAMFLSIIAVGSLLPVIAGILLYSAVRGEADLGTTFLLVGAFWIFNFVATRLTVPATAGSPEFLGMTYLVWAVVIGYMATVLALRHPMAAISIGIFALSLAGLCIAQWAHADGWNIAAGYALMLSAVVGFFATMAHRFIGASNVRQRI